MHRFSTLGYLLGMIAAVVVPLLAFAALGLTGYVMIERERFEREAVETARGINRIVEADLETLVSLLEGLSASQLLHDRNFVGFHNEARRIVDGTPNIIVLRDLGRDQFVNTQVPFGTPLPPAVPLTERERAAFETRIPVISGVYASPISGEARVAVAVPIDIGPDQYILAITVPTERIWQTLLPFVPEGWRIGIVDERGAYVTHSQLHESVSGKTAAASYLREATERAGTFTERSADGIDLLSGYYRSGYSNWLVRANVPQEIFEAPLWRSLMLLIALGAAALALSGVMAFLFGRTFIAAASGLADRAAALGAGRAVVPMQSRLVEFELAGKALATAATSILERTRELQTVLATVPAAVLFTYDPDARVVYPNGFAAEAMSLPESDAQGVSLDLVQFERDGQPVPPEEMLLRRALRGERIADEEYAWLASDGTWRTFLTNAAPLRDQDGRIVGAVLVGLDISERKRVEEQRALLVNELNHRVKNTLTTVQSLVQQSLRGAATPDQARDAVTDRLVALAKTHDLLTTENWEGAYLRDVAEAATAHFGDGERFRFSGPAVRLTPSLTLSLSLLLHELSTNATKYGALSTAEGMVEVSWRVDRDNGARRLALRWTETGGPPVVEPDQEGFGSRLIRSLSSAIGGSTAIEFKPAGVVCTIDVEL
jgi:PAS domain S-box-containing protein